MYPGANSAHGDTRVVGDFAITHARHITQHHRNPELLLESGQGFLNVIGQRSHRQVLVGCRPTGDHPVGIVWESRLRSSFSTPRLIEENIRHDKG